MSAEIGLCPVCGGEEPLADDGTLPAHTRYGRNVFRAGVWTQEILPCDGAGAVPRLTRPAD